MAHPRKSEEDKYKKMSISFEPEQLKQLISYCEREERTASWVIRKALSEWLEKHDPFPILPIPFYAFRMVSVVTFLLISFSEDKLDRLSLTGHIITSFMY